MPGGERERPDADCAQHVRGNGLRSTPVRVGEQRVAELSRVIPLVQQKVARGGRATAYVCEGGICQRPTSDPAVLTAQLKKINPYTP